MEREAQSDFMQDLSKAIGGNMYRCADCNNAYYIDGIKRYEKPESSIVEKVLAFNLTRNIPEVPTNDSVTRLFRRIGCDDLTEDESLHLRQHRLDLARQYFEKQEAER
jgi:hypothetical protein